MLARIPKRRNRCLMTTKANNIRHGEPYLQEEDKTNLSY